jgi:hypothetical protein
VNLNQLEHHISSLTTTQPLRYSGIREVSEDRMPNKRPYDGLDNADLQVKLAKPAQGFKELDISKMTWLARVP